MTNRKNLIPKVDPDPLSLAALVLSGCSILVGIAQVAATLATNVPSAPPVRHKADGNLLHIAESAREVHQALLATLRSINRGSAEPDAEFFDARFGLDQSHLFLDPVFYDQFTGHFSQLFLKLSNMNRWISTTIRMNSQITVSILEETNWDIVEISDRINKIVREGRANRELLTTFENLLTDLIDAIDRITIRRN